MQKGKGYIGYFVKDDIETPQTAYNYIVLKWRKR